MARTEISRLEYRPAAASPLDLEIMSMDDLRRKSGTDSLHRPHRYAFYLLVLVTEGRCVQQVDFEPVHCRRGSLLIIHPGQVHSFGSDQDWRGELVLFRPEFLLPKTTSSRDTRLAIVVEQLPAHQYLCERGQRTMGDTVAQMREDAALDTALDEVHALLRYQLLAAFSRMQIFIGQRRLEAVESPNALKRFHDFQQLVERHFSSWHQLASYADKLGCTEKSLTRATLEGAGVSAKAFISARIALEAKRLLVHTNSPIGSIATDLGFEEITNFSKFFKRETGQTPSQYRQRQGATEVLEQL